MKSLTTFGLATVLVALVVAPAAAAPSHEINLLAGRSQLIGTTAPLERIAVSDPKVADVHVVNNRQVLLQAVKPGTTTLYVWTKGGGNAAYNVQVGMDTAAVQQQVRELTGNQDVKIAFNGSAFLMSGEFQTASQMSQAEKIAGSYGQPVINLSAVPTARDQISIDVHVVELSRTAALNLGVKVGGGQPTNSDPNLRQYVFKPGEVQLGEAVTGKISSMAQLDFLSLQLQAMQDRGQAKMLAHPTLVTTDGGTAKFLAGGEVPIPIQQALGQTTIMWKEFGVRLEVQPTRLTDGRIAMTVKPEVSSLDFANGLKQASFSIPAVKTRRAETQVVMAPDETLMLGGLMDAEQSRALSFLPGIGDIPIIGELFKSRQFQDNQTELAILVRPRMVTPDHAEHLPGNLPETKREMEKELSKAPVSMTPAAPAVK